MAFGGNSPTDLFPPLPDSLVDAKDSFIRHAREIVAGRGLVEQDFRVPAPVTPSPALFASLSLLAASLRRHDFCVPEGTRALALMHAIVISRPNGVSILKFGLQPCKVTEKREFHRMFTSVFLHFDAPNALLGVAALIEAGNIIEEQMGAVPFVADVALVTLMSHGLYVVVTWMQHSLLNRSEEYYIYVIGTGQISFALSTLMGIMHTDDPPIEPTARHLPACFHVWFRLAITQLLFPQSNFLGHLIGISAGLIRAFCPRPFIWFRKKVTSVVRFVTRQHLCNGDDDERSLAESRRNVHPLQHLCLLSALLLGYLFQTRPRKQRFR